MYRFMPNNEFIYLHNYCKMYNTYIVIIIL